MAPINKKSTTSRTQFLILQGKRYQFTPRKNAFESKVATEANIFLNFQSFKEVLANLDIFGCIWKKIISAMNLDLSSKLLLNKKTPSKSSKENNLKKLMNIM